MSARSDGQKKRQARAKLAGDRRPPKPPREHTYGTCAACGYRREVRKDGTIGTHVLYQGHRKEKCVGVGQPPRLEVTRG